MESAQGNGAGYQSSRLTPGARRAQGLTSLTCELDFSVPASLVFGAVGVTATRRAWVLLPVAAAAGVVGGVLLPLDAHGVLLPVAAAAGVVGGVLLPLDAHVVLLPGCWCWGLGGGCYCHSTRMGFSFRAGLAFGAVGVTATRRAWGSPSGCCCCGRGGRGVTATRRACGPPSGLLVLGAGRWVLLPLDAHRALLPGCGCVRVGVGVTATRRAWGSPSGLGWRSGAVGVTATRRACGPPSGLGWRSGRWVLLPLDAHRVLLPGRWWCSGRGGWVLLPLDAHGASYLVAGGAVRGFRVDAPTADRGSYV